MPFTSDNEYSTLSTLVLIFVILVVLVLKWYFRKAGGGSKIQSSHSLIEQYSKDLTRMAQEKKLDPVVGREKEISKIIRILSRKNKNNPVLIGKAGVGKTAIVEGLAERIIEGTVPQILRNKRVLAIDLTGLIAGTKFRGDFEKRLLEIRDYIANSNRSIIAFIDEVHMIAGAGEASGSLGADDILKPALSRGEFQLVGATTQDEYDQYIKKDSTLARRFQPVAVPEPDAKQTLEILKGIKEKYEAFHGVKIHPDTLTEAIKIAQKYRKDRPFPDKAIDLIDEACAKVQIDNVETKNSSKVRLIVRPMHVREVLKD